MKINMNDYIHVSLWVIVHQKERPKEGTKEKMWLIYRQVSNIRRTLVGN